jgi:uncharacterized Zn-binding protein involved in type VI secretion
MGRRVIRVGDPGSHGGMVITGSPDVFANSKPVARLGDLYACPIHGINPIVTASPNTTANSKGVVRVGDLTLCGATLIEGSPDTFCNGGD